MRVRSATAADLVGLEWLDGGTRDGFAAAVAAAPGATLCLSAAGSGKAAPLGLLAVDLRLFRGRDGPWLWLVEVRPEHRGRDTGRVTRVTVGREGRGRRPSCHGHMPDEVESP